MHTSITSKKCVSVCLFYRIDDVKSINLRILKQQSMNYMKKLKVYSWLILLIDINNHSNTLVSFFPSVESFDLNSSGNLRPSFLPASDRTSRVKKLIALQKSLHGRQVCRIR